MANVYITDSESKTDLRYEVNGQDIMDDLLAGTGEFGTLEDGCEEYWMLTEYDFDWWEKWIEREERISKAYEDASDDIRARYERAVREGSSDMERLQDELEKALGIEEE